MGKTKNFFLMLKQGIKGVFKFKAQFIIIIILAFIATFILSVSLSTQLRMQDSYNKIVKPVKKFSYSGNIQVGSTASSNADPFIMATELDNSGNTETKISTDGKDQKGNDTSLLLRDTTAFNFVLNNPDGVYKDVDGTIINTFLTQGTADYIAKNKDVNDAFYNNTNNGATALYKSWMTALFEDLWKIDNINDQTKLEKEVGQTLYSPIALFTKENSNWYKPFVNFDKDGKVTGFNFKENDKPNKDVFNNVSIATGQLAGWINDVANKKDLSTDETGQTKMSVKDAISFFFDVAKDNAYTIYPTINTNALKDQIPNDHFVNIDSADLKAKDRINKAIFKSGLRGITNPLIDQNQNPAEALKNNTYSTDLISNWDYLTPLTISNANYDIYNNMSNDDNFYATTFDEGNIWSIVDNSNKQPLPGESLFRTHNVISASATGFDYKIRRETDYFDANSQLKFRAIALDPNEDYNFSILRGRKPSQTGEVAVSEQFAKKNHLTVGSMMVVGDADFVISALATDAMSYLPSQDLSDPIPNPKVAAFIYAAPVTIDMMNGGAKGADVSDDAITKNLSYFLFDNKNNEATVNARENAFQALFSNDQEALIGNYRVAKAFATNGNKDVLTGSSHISLDEFAKSGFRYSWTLQPLVFKVYDAITYSVAGVVAIIAMIALIVCVKKTIDLNSKQIGILKALGEKPTSISVNYLSYSVIISFIVVPLGWIAGIILQIPFGNMFLTYFSVQPDAILFDWISFVIAFGVLGILSGIVSYGSAWMLTNKPVLKVLTSSIKWGRLRLLDWMKNHTFKRAPFSTRFSLTLTSSGSKQIVLMTVVMFVASLLMSAVLAIPSIVVKVNSSYYKSVAYANKYEEIPMTGNAPLSKNSISYWNGQDYLAQDFIGGDKSLQLDNSTARYGYYDDPEAYTATVSNSNTISQYMYDANSNTVADGQLYILQHQQDLMNIVGGMFGNNFFTHLGVSFSIGEIDKLYGILLHSLDHIFDADSTNSSYTDNVKLAQARNLSGWLTTAVPKIIGTITSTLSGNNADEGGDQKDLTWKQKVMNVIYKVVPSYVKAYIRQSDSRLDQYAIAFNNEIFIPGQEALTTNVDYNKPTVNGKVQQMTLTGLDKNQNSIKINEKDINNVYLDKATKEKILDVLNAPVDSSTKTRAKEQDIVANGMKIYDASTHTLTIPVLPNEQAASGYGLAKGNSMDWDNNAQLIQFKVGQNWIDLPKTAWAYNDTDWATYIAQSDQGVAKKFNHELPNSENIYDSSKPNNGWIYDKVDTNGQTRYYLDPTRIDNNKLTYSNEFSYNDGPQITPVVDANLTGQTKDLSLMDRAYMFKDFKYNKDGDPSGTYIRPYYQYKNMQLFIPIGKNHSWVNEDLIKFPDPSDKSKSKGTQWYKEVSYDEVPKSVRDGYYKLSLNNQLDWSDVDGTGTDKPEWLVINPYDINFMSDNFQQKQTAPLNNLISGPSYWFRYALDGDTQLRIVNSESTKEAFVNEGASKDLKIRLKSVGTIDSYNDKLVVADSDIANMLAQYPLNRHYEYNYQTFDRNNPENVKAGDKDNNKYVSQFSRYKFTNTTTDDSFITDDWSKNPSLKQRDLWDLSYDKYKQQISGSIENYAPHAFYNGKLSNVDEALNFTSQISFTKKTRWGQAAIALGDNSGGGTPSIISGSVLLSTTKELIKQIAVLAISIGAMLMVAIIITAALVTMLTGDIYIAQYQRFMVLLRALGYSKSQVFTYTFGTVTILAFAAWVVGTILAWGLIFIGVNIMWNAGFAIPAGITWWPIVISLVVMFASYFGSLYVSSGRARKSNPSTILTATAE